MILFMAESDTRVNAMHAASALYCMTFSELPMKRFLFLATLVACCYLSTLAHIARADDSPKPDEKRAASAATLFDQLYTNKAGKLTRNQ